jgi:large subunit ribosomal protein L9
MKVLLLKDVFKLGRAGDIKRVADGYGRNFLLPQGLAVLATPGALNQVDRIKSQAKVQREALNEELGSVAEQLDGMVLRFKARASETGKLYGSINAQMIAESITEKTDVEITRNQVYTQPLRTLGEHTIEIRLTVDLIPELTVIVQSEGEEEEIPVMQEPAKPESDEDEEVQEAEQLESSAELEQQEEESEAEYLNSESQDEVSEEFEDEEPVEETEVEDSEEESETEAANETAVD